MSRVPAAHLRPASLRTLMRRLRRYEPLSAPVRLIQSRGVRCGGSYVLGVTSYRRAWKNGKPGKPIRYRIVVDSRLPIGERWEVIVHEYAHCIDRDTRHKSPKDCHDARWGICFARAFRASIRRAR